MRRIVLGVFCLFTLAASAFALNFPKLTGRVVDQASILSPASLQTLDTMLANYETQSTNQIAVVTLSSLEGDSIEDYGYQLGRAWGIGQKGKDNGALLIIAPNERKIRIEVGYGLEGILTDAASRQIIDDYILPQFRQGHIDQGIIDGTTMMIGVLGGSVTLSPHTSPSGHPMPAGKAVFLICIWILIIMLRFNFLPIFFPSLLRGNSSSGWGGGLGGSFGGGFSGGFSGGGGSFGGGGASGGW